MVVAGEGLPARAGPRIITPLEWLEKAGGRPGQPTQVDVDTEAFVGPNIDGNANDKLVKPELLQAAIRVADHIDGTLALTERIASACGYSPQTFGLHIDGNAQSGTALRIRRSGSPAITGRSRAGEFRE